MMLTGTRRALPVSIALHKIYRDVILRKRIQYNAQNPVLTECPDVGYKNTERSCPQIWHEKSSDVWSSHILTLLINRFQPTIHFPI